MPWKYLALIILLIIIIIFIGFNLENKANISFVFTSLTDIPVYFLVLISFSLGALITLPISIISRQKSYAKKKEIEKVKSERAEEKDKKKEKKIKKHEEKGSIE